MVKYWADWWFGDQGDRGLYRLLTSWAEYCLILLTWQLTCVWQRLPRNWFGRMMSAACSRRLKRINLTTRWSAESIIKLKLVKETNARRLALELWLMCRTAKEFMVATGSVFIKMCSIHWSAAVGWKDYRANWRQRLSTKVIFLKLLIRLRRWNVWKKSAFQLADWDDIDSIATEARQKLRNQSRDDWSGKPYFGCQSSRYFYFDGLFGVEVFLKIEQNQTY